MRHRKVSRHSSSSYSLRINLTCYYFSQRSKNIVKILLQSPVRESINDVDNQGFNCLYYAVYHGHLPVVKLLKSVSINYEKDKKGTSAVHIAIMRGHHHIVDFLLKKTPKFVDEVPSTVANKNPPA